VNGDENGDEIDLELSLSYLGFAARHGHIEAKKYYDDVYDFLRAAWAREEEEEEEWEVEEPQVGNEGSNGIHTGFLGQFRGGKDKNQGVGLIT